MCYISLCFGVHHTHTVFAAGGALRMPYGFNSILIDRGDRVSIQGDGHPTMAAALSAFGSPDVYVKSSLLLLLLLLRHFLPCFCVLRFLLLCCVDQLVCHGADMISFTQCCRRQIVAVPTTQPAALLTTA